MAVQLRALAETDVRQPIPSSQLLPALQTPPFVPVPGTFNTRDLGLLEEEDNNKTSRPKIRPGFLYRSGSLDELRDHPAGQAQLRDELGVRRVFDLRSRAERAAAPDPEVPGVETVWLVPGGGCGSGEEGKGGKEEEGEVDEEEEERRRTRRTTVDLEAFVEGCGEKGYVAMYMDVLATYGAVFREVLRSVRDRPREGILFHCTAGRDRTGVLAGLLESLAGYDQEIIRADFLLTRIGYEPARRRLLQLALQGSGVAGDDQDDDEKETKDGVGSVVDLSPLYEVPGFYNLVSLRAECWDAFDEAVRERWGGFEGYAREVLGFSGEDLVRIARNLVEAPGV